MKCYQEEEKHSLCNSLFWSRRCVRTDWLHVNNDRYKRAEQAMEKIIRKHIRVRTRWCVKRRHTNTNHQTGTKGGFACFIFGIDIFTIGGTRAVKPCFLPPLQTAGATQRVGGVGCVFVCVCGRIRNIRGSSFTGILGLAECSPGRKGGGCERTG